MLVVSFRSKNQGSVLEATRLKSIDARGVYKIFLSWRGAFIRSKRSLSERGVYSRVRVGVCDFYTISKYEKMSRDRSHVTRTDI